MSNRPIWITVAALLAGMVIQSTGGMPLPPNLERASPEQQRQYIQTHSQQSLQEQVQVGEQRFQRRQVLREALLECMRANTDDRLQDIVSSPLAASPAGVPARSSGPMFALLIAVLLVAGVFAFLYLQSDAAHDTAVLVTEVPAFRKLLPGLTQRIEAELSRTPSRARAARQSRKVLAEEESFSEFVAAFRIGPQGASGAASLSGTHPDAGPGAVLADAPVPQCNPMQAFLASAPKLILESRRLLQGFARSADDATRRRILGELGGEIQRLKGMADLPELLPAWQMASALECLFRQLAGRQDRITPSTLHTAAGGLDLLEDLCRPGLRPELCTKPPLRLLAVDDDAVSRHAISFALRKGLHQTDLAENGQAALALAAKQIYDVIFLDVQMPEMDGFELCSKIHDTTPNRTTPVVFVTCQSDFEARAKSTLCGGNDLIGKPFLTFEITVKALTLAVRGRLQKQDQPAGTSEAVACTKTLPPSAPEGGALPAEATPPSPSTALVNPPRSSHPSRELRQAAKNNVPLSAAAAANALTSPPAHDLIQKDPAAATLSAVERSALAPEKLAKQFVAHTSALLGPVIELARSASQPMEEEERRQMVVDLYLRIHSLVPPAECQELRPAFQVTLALDGLLKKMLEDPDNSTPSVLQTIIAALDLLKDLYDKGVQADLATNPPIRMLAVDDDIVTRRVMANALQLAFPSPECAADGEAALALAATKSFDLIFLDVRMPGMDGFEACAKIHETPANRSTPVVFVTSLEDLKSRELASKAGGSGFVTKPFLSSEIRLKALTFALRGRLQRNRSPETEAVAASPNP